MICQTTFKLPNYDRISISNHVVVAGLLVAESRSTDKINGSHHASPGYVATGVRGGGESATSLSLVGEYSYQLLRHGPILEVALQAGGFGDSNDQPQEGRRNYKYRSLFVGAGINAGTGLRGLFFAKAGAGVAYYHGSESDEYQQQVTDKQGNPVRAWLAADRRYREPVLNVNAAIGVRLSHHWEIDLKGTLFTGISGGNALLLIGPGLSRRF